MMPFISREILPTLDLRMTSNKVSASISLALPSELEAEI